MAHKKSFFFHRRYISYIIGLVAMGDIVLPHSVCIHGIGVQLSHTAQDIQYTHHHKCYQFVVKEAHPPTHRLLTT